MDFDILVYMGHGIAWLFQSISYILASILLWNFSIPRLGASLTAGFVDEPPYPFIMYTYREGGHGRATATIKKARNHSGQVFVNKIILEIL